MTANSNNVQTKRPVLHDQRGQSAVEYLIVVGAVVSALIAAPSAFNMVRDMMQNKYRSYSFGVAISDPPSSVFDQEVAKDATAVKEAMDALHKLEKFIEHPVIPQPKKPSWPEMPKL